MPLLLFLRGEKRVIFCNQKPKRLSRARPRLQSKNSLRYKGLKKNRVLSLMLLKIPDAANAAMTCFPACCGPHYFLDR
ncbi:hypothetical protein EVA_12047 [gut metagenome]|uniref:Uncharacterized protein n=1 Tax=gut metagenome TaxID=749906 RepID=J9FZ37_9ZZZZ